jgi:tetratricopeptide (TPR) repeat protein
LNAIMAVKTSCSFSTTSTSAFSSRLSHLLDRHRPSPKGSAYMWLGRYPEALASITEQTRLDPHDIIAYSNLEDTCLALNRFDEAKSALDEARAQWPHYGYFPAYELAFFRGDQATMLKQTWPMNPQKLPRPWT